MLTSRGSPLLWLSLLLIAPPRASAQEPDVPPIPMDIPVMLVGDPRIDGASLQPYEGVWSVGTVGKAGPLRPGERIRATNISLQKLERAELDGRTVWRRTVLQKETGTDAELITAIIYMELESLRPIRALAQQPGATPLGFDYDWDAFTVRTLGAGTDAPALMTADLVMFEAAAHEIWMSALPYTEGFTAKIPALMASAEAKYWAVPRVVGSEIVDPGDGTELDAWVVELDWWGMGADNSYFPGGGRNDTAGSGGKYWILKDPPAGMGRVFRVRTEIDENTDVVVQLQGGR